MAVKHCMHKCVNDSEDLTIVKRYKKCPSPVTDRYSYMSGFRTWQPAVSTVDPSLIQEVWHCFPSGCSN